MACDKFLFGFIDSTKRDENCEDVALNMILAAFIPDYRSLCYLTAPKVVVSNSRNHVPGAAIKDLS